MKRQFVWSVLIFIGLLGVGGYISWRFHIINMQDVPYVKKTEIEELLQENMVYFYGIADFYKEKDSEIVLYDLSMQSYKTEVSEEEKNQINQLFVNYHFNTIDNDKETNTLCIYYNRPFTHSVQIGLCYDYKEETWTYLYSHNYKRCCPMVFGGSYKLFDLVKNRLGTIDCVKSQFKIR